MSTASVNIPSNPKKSSNISYYLHIIVMFILIFGIRSLPAIDPITPLGMEILGIFVGLLYGWTFIDLGWTSLLSLILLGFTDLFTMKEAFMKGFGADVTLLVLFMLVYSAYLDSVGFTKCLAYWFVSRKVCIGRPWVLVSMIILATYVMAMCVSLNATILIVWSIFYRMCDIVGYKPHSSFSAYVLIGIMFSACLGYAVFPFKVVQAVVVSSLSTTIGYEIDFFAYSISTFLITILCLIGFILFGKYVVKPDVSLLSGQNDHFLEFRGQKMNFDQKIGAFSIILYLIIVMAPSLLPNHWGFISFCKNLGMTQGIVLILVLLMSIKLKSKDAFMRFTPIAAKGLNWDIVLLLAATMPLSHAMTSEQTGIMLLLTNKLGPVVANLNPLVFCLFFTLFTGIMTQVTHNLVLGAIVTPIMCQFALVIGVNPGLVATSMAFALALSFCTPAASTHCALAFANKDWITTKQVYGYTFALFIISMTILLTVGQLIFNFFF